MINYMSITYESLSPEELIKKLGALGDLAPLGLIQAVIERKEETLPILVRIFQDRNYWEAEDNR